MILRAGFRSTWAAVAFYAGMLVFVVLTLFPLVWVFKMSIVTQSELFQTPPTILPQKIITDNYERVFNDVRFQKGVINSVVIAGFTTVLHRLHSRLRDCSDQVSLQGARARPCAGDRFLPRRGHPGAVVPSVHELRDRQHVLGDDHPRPLVRSPAHRVSARRLLSGVAGRSRGGGQGRRLHNLAGVLESDGATVAA